MPRKIFVAGEILTAADVNTNLMDQAVMVFDDSAARTTAIPTPSEGMITYLKDTDSVEKYDGSAFVGVATPPAILQVVSVTKTDTFSASVGSGATAAITDFSASITPSATSSKIFVLAYVTVGVSSVVGVEGAITPALILKRDSTGIALGDAASARTRVTTMSTTGDGSNGNNAVTFLDSPATTSSVTYSFDILNRMENTATQFVNRNADDADNSRRARSSSSITLMEVAG